MPVARRGSLASIAAASGTSVTGTMPSGGSAPQANDVIVAVINNNTQATITVAPSGYTFLRRVNNSTNLATDIYYKVAAGGEGDVTATLSASSKWIVQIAIYSGVDTTNPFGSPKEENGASETVNQAAHPTPSVTNTDASAWAIATYCWRGGTAATWTPDAALAELMDSTTASSSQIAACFDDSNGAVTAAAHSYTATASAADTSVTMWLGYLHPATAATAAYVPAVISQSMGIF